MKVVIEGINGAGKTPTIDCLISEFEQVGMKARSYAPYHLVRDKIDGSDIYPLWSSDPFRAIDKLTETIDEIEHEAEESGVDALIFDRHWMTAFTQLDKCPEISEMWTIDKPKTVLMTSPIEHSSRIALRGYSAEWLQQEQLESYTKIYDQLHYCYPGLMLGRFVVSSQRQDLHPIAQNIFNLLINEQGEL